MYKCVKAFYTTRQEKYYYGMRMPLQVYKNLTPNEQKNFVLEVEDVSQAAILDITTAMRNANNNDIPNTDNTTNEFQGYDNGSSGGGGAS